MARKVIAVGLDGFEPTVADELVRQGRMPFYAELLRKAAVFDLDHGEARYTGLAWEHFSTGLSPDDYKRWSAVSFDKQNYGIIQKATRCIPFTAKLDARVLAFDVPYHELSSGNLSGVANWGAHDPGIHAHSRPAGLAREIEERFGTYPAKEFIYGYVWPDAELTATMATRLNEALKMRSDISGWLMAERLPDWDLAILVVSEFHSALEALWHGWDENHPLHTAASAALARRGIVDLHDTLDAMLARLSARFPKATLCLFSPHGMGPNLGDLPSMALLPEVLYRDRFDEPWLRADPSWTDPQAPNLLDPNDWSRSVLPYYGPPPAKALARKWNRLMYRLRKNGDPATGTVASLSDDLPLNWMPVAKYRQFWPQMRAFAVPSFYDGRLRINLRGREACGIVPLDEYEAELDRIEGVIRALRDWSTGEPVVSSAYRPVREDPLAAADSQCDMRIVWHRDYVGFTHPDLGTIGPLPYRRTGGHTGGHGFAAFYDRSMVAGSRGIRSTFDFVPTLLALLDQPAGKALGLTGEVMLEEVSR
jgi:predicted AlkP superfamily phosphohydrolase/phosphomutase